MAGINIQQISVKIYNQFDNGESFTDDLVSVYTSYLQANVGEYQKYTANIKLSWTSEASATDEFTISGNTITRLGAGDFTDDGFVLNDIIDFYDASGGSAIIQDRTILSISASSITFDGASVGSTTNATSVIYGKTPIENLNYKYNLIENSQSPTYVSIIDSIAENEFYASNIGFDTGGGVRSTSPITMSPIAGVQSWYDTGIVTITYKSTENESGDFAQLFEIDHTFYVLPYYLDGWLPNLQNLTPPSPYFDTSNCLKYINYFEFRNVLNDPNTARIEEFNSTLGNTGWLDEQFNGYVNAFSVDSVSITDASFQTLTAVDPQKTSKITIILNSDNNVLTGDDLKISVFVSYLPDQSSYSQNLNNIKENFVFDQAIHQYGQAPISSNNIKNYEITAITGATATIEFDLEYTASEQSYIQSGKYIICCGVEDNNFSGNTAERVMLLAQLSDYYINTDVFDLMFVDEFKFVPHDMNDSSSSLYDDYKGWIEDGFQIQAPFKLNTDLGAYLTSLSLEIIAYDSTNGQNFTIQSNNFDLNSAVIVSGIQAININQTNNFKLDNSSDFKKIELQNTGSGTHLSYNVQNYDLKHGVRFNFEEWIALLSADTIFYNASQLNNGLNLVTSNYSTAFTTSPQTNYSIKARLNASVSDSNNVITNYQFLSEDLSSYYYDTDDREKGGPRWIGDIEIFDLDNNLINAIYDNANTRIKATFTKSPISPPPDLSNPWGWIRLDIQQGDINTPSEISTIYTPISSSPLIPLPSETRCKITNSGASVILEAEIDYTKIPAGSILSVSARLSENNDEITTYEIESCEPVATYYTDTDLSAYLGQYLMNDLYECYRVIGTSTNAVTLPGFTVIGGPFTNCSECNNSVKSIESGSSKTTESGSLKTIE